MRGHESRQPPPSADLRRPLSVQTDGPDSADAASDADSEFVTCVPSPHMLSLSHLRRDLSVLSAAASGDARGCAKKVKLDFVTLQ